jgi:hypothetical protein
MSIQEDSGFQPRPAGRTFRTKAVRGESVTNAAEKCHEMWNVRRVGNTSTVEKLTVAQ